MSVLILHLYVKYFVWNWVFDLVNSFIYWERQIMKMMKTQPPKIENQAAYERVSAAVKRMAAEKEEEYKTAVERYQNDPHL
ncbi:hypothetical protein [Spirosoma litoris]